MRTLYSTLFWVLSFTAIFSFTQEDWNDNQVYIKVVLIALLQYWQINIKYGQPELFHLPHFSVTEGIAHLADGKTILKILSASNEQNAISKVFSTVLPDSLHWNNYDFRKCQRPYWVYYNKFTPYFTILIMTKIISQTSEIHGKDVESNSRRAQ